MGSRNTRKNKTTTRQKKEKKPKYVDPIRQQQQKSLKRVNEEMKNKK